MTARSRIDSGSQVRPSCPSASCFTGYVNPGFPLIDSDLLVRSKAVFGGVVEDAYVGSVTTVCDS